MREIEFAGLTFQDNSPSNFSNPSAYLIMDNDGKERDNNVGVNNLKYASIPNFEAEVRKGTVHNFRWKDGEIQYNKNISENKARCAAMLLIPWPIAIGMVHSDKSQSKHYFDMAQRRFVDAHVRQAIVKDDVIAAGVYNCVVKGEKTVFCVTYYGKNVGAYIQHLRNKYPQLEKFIDYHRVNNASVIMPYKILLDESISTGEFSVLYCTQVLHLDPKTRSKYIQGGSQKFEAELQEVADRLDAITARNFESIGEQITAVATTSSATSLTPVGESGDISFDKGSKVHLYGFVYEGMNTPINSPCAAITIQEGVDNFVIIDIEKFKQKVAAKQVPNVRMKDGTMSYANTMDSTEGKVVTALNTVGAGAAVATCVLAPELIPAVVAGAVEGGIFAAAYSGPAREQLYYWFNIRHVDKHLTKALNDSSFLSVSLCHTYLPQKTRSENPPVRIDIIGNDVDIYAQDLLERYPALQKKVIASTPHSLTLYVPFGMLATDELACGRKLLYSIQMFNDSYGRKVTNNFGMSENAIEEMKRKLVEVTNRNLGTESSANNFKLYAEKYSIPEEEMPAEIERLKSILNVTTVEQLQEAIAVLL